ncbi:MAG: 50S ribosomal protein L23 [Candidatus Eisenbacteria bacterium]|uniref:Large ribosomal subunit protein uL23 n=1 Tax=Eiseniibacteriota bacterium TaxID=2212470 RepID=A0A538T0I6_UNCEI|nr:MAG: 50S ribosomal protein L23 [Candidatus Eisenbacteria bacterium]
MNREPRTIVRRAMISEKGTRLREKQNGYLFEVSRDANKIEIKRAIESIFNVKVDSVRTIRVHGKPKRMGRFAGHRPDWKKALVTLKKGQTIELFEQV